MPYDLHRFFELSLDMLCIADMNGTFIHVNRAFETTLGWTEQQLLSQAYINFVHPHDRGATLNEVEKLHSGIPSASFENRYRCVDGSYKYLRWTTYPDQEAGYLYGVARDVTEMKAYEQRLQASNDRLELLASLDGLTGLYNRRQFNDSAQQVIRLMQRLQKSVSLVLLDIDHFKYFNDSYGHLAGDEVLKLLASVMHSVARDSDIVARFGGEEFIMILPDTDALAALTVADKIQRELQQRKWRHATVTCSYGVASYRATNAYHKASEQVLKTLIDEADQALYAAKNKGRDQAIHFATLSAARAPIGW